MNWAGETQPQLDLIAEEARTALQLYCDGVNAATFEEMPVGA